MDMTLPLCILAGTECFIMIEYNQDKTTQHYKTFPSPVLIPAKMFPTDPEQLAVIPDLARLWRLVTR